MRKYLLYLFLCISMGTNAQSELIPRQLVNNLGSTEIEIKSFKTIYTVPIDSVFIITDLMINGFYSTGYLFSNKKPAIQLDNKVWFHSCTGIQFESGSQIMLYNEANVSTSARWHFIGYLQKKQEK